MEVSICVIMLVLHSFIGSNVKLFKVTIAFKKIRRKDLSIISQVNSVMMEFYLVKYQSFGEQLLGKIFIIELRRYFRIVLDSYFLSSSYRKPFMWYICNTKLDWQECRSTVVGRLSPSIVADGGEFNLLDLDFSQYLC